MKRDELASLSKTNPFLALRLCTYDDAALEKLTVITDQTAKGHALQKYHEFCKCLGMKRYPPLLVYDDDKVGGDAHGRYILHINSVFVTRKVYDGFQTGEAFAEYVLAHELGHSKDMLSRRFALKTAATAIGCILSGKGIFDTTEMVKKRTGYGHWIASGAAGTAISVFSALAAKEVFIRQMEFTADAYAAKILTNQKVLEVLVEEVKESLEKCWGQEKFNAELVAVQDKIQKTLERRNLAATPDELHLMAMITIASTIVEQRSPLEKMMRLTVYPTASERIYDRAKSFTPSASRH
jgi:hypothetical protein